MRPATVKEIEFKWSVRSRMEFRRFLTAARKLGARLGSGKQLRIEDTYLDAKDGFFRRKRAALRIRKINGRMEMTLKSASSFKKGLATRSEATFPLCSPAQANQELKKILPHQPIVPLFTIRNRRTARKVILPGGTKAELNFDDLTIRRKNLTLKMLEIELEWLNGNLQKFKQFARRATRLSRLRLARISKVATAVKVFSL